MAAVRAKKMWDQFDGPMRAALRYQAKQRAQRRAVKEMAQLELKKEGSYG